MQVITEAESSEECSSHAVPASHCPVHHGPPSSGFCCISAASSAMFPEPGEGFHRRVAYVWAFSGHLFSVL